MKTTSGGPHGQVMNKQWSGNTERLLWGLALPVYFPAINNKYIFHFYWKRFLNRYIYNWENFPSVLKIHNSYRLKFLIYVTWWIVWRTYNEWILYFTFDIIKNFFGSLAKRFNSFWRSRNNQFGFVNRWIQCSFWACSWIFKNRIGGTTLVSSLLRNWIISYNNIY